MLLPFRSDRRIVGRSEGARLHRDAAAGGCVGAQRHALLAGADGGHCEPERRPDAVADPKRAVAAQSARPKGAGIAGLGRRAVPRAGNAARPLEHRA